MQVFVRNQDGHRVIALHGEMDLYTSVKLRATIMDNLQDQPASVVIDLTALTYIDSSGIALFTDLRNLTCDRGAEFALLNPLNRVQASVKQAALDNIFKTYDSVAQLERPASKAQAIEA